MQRARPPGTGIVWRFAVATLAVFVAITVVISSVHAKDVRRREEADAAARARLVALGAVQPLIVPSDLDGPITGERYVQLRQHIETYVLDVSSVARVKIWNPDGMVVFSDDPDQVGLAPEMEDDLEAALDGELESDISDLSKPENVSERRLASSLYETYVPLRFTDGGPVAGVIEVYQDYSPIEAEVSSLTRTLTLTLGIGLAVLWAALLPVMIGATRILRRQNEQLTELLGREQATVAELRELDRMKNDFVAAASHELRTPLTTIQGWTRTLLAAPAAEDPETREALTAIERQSSRMYRLVQNLLREAQLEQGAAATRVGTVRVEDLLADVRNDFPGARERLRLAIDGEPPAVSVDRDLLAEILVNLVDNALKYSPSDAPVELGARYEESRLQVWVRDRGPGIPTADVPRIFDRFQQLDGSITRTQGGVGLGLHLVKALVERSGGRITVDSEVGAGSTFIVSIPAAVAAAPVGAR